MVKYTMKEKYMLLSFLRLQVPDTENGAPCKGVFRIPSTGLSHVVHPFGATAFCRTSGQGSHVILPKLQKKRKKKGKENA